MGDEHFAFFTHPTPQKVLIYLLNRKEHRSYASLVSKKTDTTYSHTVRILENMRRFGWVTKYKKGRIQYIKLTRLGEEIAAMLNPLYHKLKSL